MQHATGWTSYCLSLCYSYLTNQLSRGDKLKISTNEREIKYLGACKGGYLTFIKAHGNKDALLSQFLDSNGWGDVWWLIEETYEQFSEEQRHDLRIYGCQKALANIEKIKPYCSDPDYELIVSYLNRPEDSADLADSARLAAKAAADLAKAAAKSVEKAAAKSAWFASWRSSDSKLDLVAPKLSAWAEVYSVKAAADSAADLAIAVEDVELVRIDNIKDLRNLFLKWESK